MVASNYDRSLQLAFGDEMVEGQPEPVALAIAEPADPRRQALKLYFLSGHRDPAVQMLVFGEHFEHQPVSARDVRGFSGKRGPPERPLSLAKQGPDVGWYKSGERIGVLYSRFVGKGSDIVSVVERHRTELLEFQHSLHMLAHRGYRPFPILLRIRLAQFQGLLQRYSVWD